ncbi:MAG: DegT/DnrJ/EryC1/StrS family aminotransferase [Humidesulfovibrio sp.]|uniref:DegT/DnrJ/EryC1/StrS family aminotransferase n=1 Tax=Humidesulfovibrio sp. TaxID=2910988 RepID=UPI0027EC48B4|nr:DegT/DnrJ/EryC1/StrS family aminotransferase [Humidesulfovibrio sp.]MDQ7836337.1 DegT/DnrJ/EryC1/StrS family aminotransferase [Humidesulfovibrio sp.]
MSHAKAPRLFLSPPHLGGDETRRVAEAFASNYIAPLGPQVDAFEAAFAECTGLPHCLALSSGTAAMHLALHCLGVGPGDVVVASSLTFIGSVSPAHFLGAEVVFVDSDRATWNMDPDRLREALMALASEGRRVKAVIPTDLYGQCADYRRLLDICAPFGVPVVADAAEAMGARYGHGDDAVHAGAFPGLAASIFSFNGNKIITTSGGGMLASEDADFIAHARKLSQQAREHAPHYEHKEIGYNYRLSNILAAIGLGQLDVLEARVASRRRIFRWYQEALAALPGLSFMPEAAYGKANRWLTVVEIDAKAFGATPEAARQALEAQNIESRPVWKPMHAQPVYAGCRVFGGTVAEEQFARGLCLPSGTAMTRDDVARVAAILADVSRRGRA